MDTILHAFLPFALTLLRLSIWLLLLSLIFIPLERLMPLHKERVFRTGIVTDIGYYFLNGIVPVMLLSVPLALVIRFTNTYIPAEIGATVTQLPILVKVIASLFVGEVGYYWAHRLGHEIPFLWRFHSIHHAPKHIDWLVNTHAHPLDMVFSRFFALSPMILLGLLNPFGANLVSTPFIMIFVATLWGFFVHANVPWRFGPLEWLVATPGFHHWHHTNDGREYINKNYASMLPIVDYIFGTFYLPKDKRSQRFGIETPMPDGLAEQLLFPFQSK